MNLNYNPWKIKFSSSSSSSLSLRPPLSLLSCRKALPLPTDIKHMLFLYASTFKSAPLQPRDCHHCAYAEANRLPLDITPPLLSVRPFCYGRLQTFLLSAVFGKLDPCLKRSTWDCGPRPCCTGSQQLQ